MQQDSALLFQTPIDKLDSWLHKFSQTLRVFVYHCQLSVFKLVWVVWFEKLGTNQNMRDLVLSECLEGGCGGTTANEEKWVFGWG